MRHERKGFTVIEVLISALLLIVIAGGIFAAFTAVDKMHELEMGLLQLQQHARLAMDLMSRELRVATGVAVSNESPAILNFNAGGATNIRYYLDEDTDQIVREYPQGTLKVLGNYINFLNFSRDGSLLEIQLRGSKDIRGRTIFFPAAGALIEKVRLRNE